MIIWMWRMFAKYVIGLKLLPEIPLDERCWRGPSGCERWRPGAVQRRSPLCAEGACRACCSRHLGCNCESKTRMTDDEIKMLAEYRSAVQARGLSS